MLCHFVIVKYYKGQELVLTAFLQLSHWCRIWAVLSKCTLLLYGLNELGQPGLMYLGALEPRGTVWHMEGAHWVLMSGPPPHTHFFPQQNDDMIGPFSTWEHIHIFKKHLVSIYWMPGTVPGSRDQVNKAPELMLVRKMNNKQNK